MSSNTLTPISANIFNGLSNSSVTKALSIGSEYTYEEGVVCQTDRKIPKYIESILEGKVGVEVNISTARFPNRIIIDFLGPRETFGLAALMGEEAWSKLRVLKHTRVLRITPERLLELCEEDKVIGYTVMKNVSHIIISRLRSERNLMFRAMMEIKVFNL